MSTEPTLTPTELLERLNLSIQVPRQTPAQNHYSTCLELMRRASELDEAIRALKLPYTYTIVEGTPQQQQARQMLGQATVEMLTNLRDKIATGAIERYLQYDALTNGGVCVRLAQGITNDTRSAEATPSESSTPQQEGV